MRGLSDHATNVLPERACVGDTVRHERRQDLARVERGQFAESFQLGDIERSLAEAFLDRGRVFRRRDDDRGFVLGQALGQKTADDAAEGIGVLVKADCMKMAGLMCCHTKRDYTDLERNRSSASLPLRSS